MCTQSGDFKPVLGQPASGGGYGTRSLLFHALAHHNILRLQSRFHLTLRACLRVNMQMMENVLTNTINTKRNCRVFGVHPYFLSFLCTCYSSQDSAVMETRFFLRLRVMETE